LPDFLKLTIVSWRTDGSSVVTSSSYHLVTVSARSSLQPLIQRPPIPAPQTNLIDFVWHCVASPFWGPILHTNWYKMIQRTIIETLFAPLLCMILYNWFVWGAGFWGQKWFCIAGMIVRTPFTQFVCKFCMILYHVAEFVCTFLRNLTPPPIVSEPREMTIFRATPVSREVWDPEMHVEMLPKPSNITTCPETCPINGDVPKPAG
jgi:hypothetical protein